MIIEGEEIQPNIPTETPPASTLLRTIDDYITFEKSVTVFVDI